MAPPTSASASSPIITTSPDAHAMLSTARLKNAGAGLPSTVATLTGCIFESGDKRTSIKAQFTIAVEKIAIFRKREKLRAMNDLPEGLVQKIIGEKSARVTDDDGLAATGRQAGEILAQVRMHDEKRHEIFSRKKVSRQHCRREKVLRIDIQTKPGEIAHNPVPGAAGRVGDELERNPQLTESSDRVERARQRFVADINNAVKVDEDALDHFVFSARRRMPLPVLNCLFLLWHAPSRCLLHYGAT